MQLVALLNWYDEDDDWLYKGIRSLAKAQVDHLVAVDGAYALFPDGHPRSPDENVRSIERACHEAGIQLHLHQRDELWQGNEIEKRTFLFRMAEEITEPNVDWLLVWDADQHMGRCRDLKARLEATDRDAADVRVIEPPDPTRPAVYQPGTMIPKPVELDVRLMYRAVPGIHCEDNHYTYVAGDGRYLWGNVATDPLVPGLALYDHVHVLHKSQTRTNSRRGRQIRYYNERTVHGAEDTICKFCREKGAVQNIAVNWEWTAKGDGGWHIASALVPACPECSLEHGTPRNKPLVMPCPACNGTASRSKPCRVCGVRGTYTIENPHEVIQRGRPVVALPK